MIRSIPAFLSSSDFAAFLVDPSALGEDRAAAGGVAAVVDLTDPPGDPPPVTAATVVRTIPGVIVGVVDGACPPAADAWTALTDVVVEGGTELQRLVAAAEARPKAAAALALLLRGSEHRTVEDGLVAESAVYSLLQAGPEFAAWRQASSELAAARFGGGRDPGESPVVVVRDGDCLTVTLSRPGVHNALNTAMRDALIEALAVGIGDPALSVVVQGAGQSFCSGGDLGEFGTGPDPATTHMIRLTRNPAAYAARLGVRLTARVHGACVGAGVEIAAFAGRVVAHPQAFFALPELTLGLIPGSGGTVSLPRRIGRHRTAWLALSGERIGAEQALQWGLVDEIT